MTAITAEELKRGRRVNGGGGGSGSSVRSSGPGGGHRKSVRESAAVDQAGHPSQESDLATEDDEVTRHQSDIKVVVVESAAALYVKASPLPASVLVHGVIQSFFM